MVATRGGGKMVKLVDREELRELLKKINDKQRICIECGVIYKKKYNFLEENVCCYCDEDI